MIAPAPGTIVYVWFFGVFKHKGLVSDRSGLDGKPMVIASASNSAGVAEVPWDSFTGGRPCFVEGYPSELHPYEVLYNARCLIGQPYNVLTANCEHFVYGGHGQQPSSPQVAMVLTLSALGLLVATR